ncbi:MAG: thioredoxin domain-containing protein, partial [Pseudomonadota bacterium]|nr:thioredoxin domain-containing protein [Pseudomonadota bacterium]
MTRIRSLSLAALSAPLALALAACGSSDSAGEEAVSGEPVAAVEAPAGTNWVDTVQVTESDGYLLGNPDAPIKLLEYASLTCPACAAFAANGADQLKEDYVATGKVSYELRNQIHGPHDLVLAQMVRCGAPETYHPLSDQVWKNLQEVLSPVFERQEQFGQALSLPEDQRFV